MRKLLSLLALSAVTLTSAPALSQSYGSYGSSQAQANGYYSYDGYSRDRNGNLRDRNGNVVNDRYASSERFSVDGNGNLRDRRGRVVNNTRAERNGWFRGRDGYWLRADANYASNGYYRDRNGALRDRNGNRIDDRYAANANGNANGQAWVGDDGRTYCRKSDGTVGTVVGAVAGALLGRVIDGGRNRAVGTIVGGGAGALAGREIQRSSSDCR